MNNRSKQPHFLADCTSLGSRGKDRLSECKPVENHLHRDKLRLVRDASIEVGLKCFFLGNVRDVHFSKVTEMVARKSTEILANRFEPFGMLVLNRIGSTKQHKNKIEHGGF